MTELYGHKWTSVHGESDTSDTWGKVLAGLSREQLAIGMQTCARSSDPWPPSAPEFRAFCEAGASPLGIPDVATAWREAVEASSDVINWKFSHPIVQEAARLTDWYSIRHGIPKAETVQNRFGKRYADLAAKLQRGENLIDGQLLIERQQEEGQFAAADRAGDEIVRQRMASQGVDKKDAQTLRQELRAKVGLSKEK